MGIDRPDRGMDDYQRASQMPGVGDPVPVLQVLDNCATASQVGNVLDNFSIELVYH